MGVHIHRGTMPGGKTPICNECMVALCWDISDQEYEENKAFWDSWKCAECNGGRMSRKYWNKETGG